MNSINEQQIEENVANLEGAEAREKLRELVEKTNTCFFCSNIKTGKPFATRPMSVQKIDREGNLWFLSANDSHLDSEISKDESVQLLFQGSAHSDFLNLYGKASISYDKRKIKELWQPIMKTWFTEGEDDHRISVIKVEPKEIYYWDTKHGNAVAFLKMAAGAIIGKTLDDSIEGTLKV
jgi:general stress protein 26